MTQFPESMPVLSTPRLRLRPFTLEDAPAVRRFAGDRGVAEMTLSIPHPYPEGAAEAWILSRPGDFERREHLTLAITAADSGELIGAIGLILALEHERAELGYWIGRPHWGRGYATEAAAALVAYGFDVLGLARIHAAHFSDNPASGRVLQKVGMAHEGRQRRHILKWGERRDLELYGMLREEHAARATASPGPPPGV